MYNLHLTPEQIEIRDTVRDFARTEIKPLAEKPARMEAVDRRPMMEVLAQASELGLRTLALSEDKGGAGADALTSCIVAEELAFGDPDTAAVLSETSMLAHVLFDDLMSAGQRDRFLKTFLDDAQSQLAWGRSRIDAGIGVNYHLPFDTARMSVTAKKVGNDYILDGISHGVANAPVAGLLAISATTDPTAPGIAGVVTLLIPRAAAGMTVTVIPSGRFHGSRGDVTFKGCKVSADNLVGGKDGVIKVAKAAHHLDAVPIDVAINLGIGRAAHEASIDYGKLRVQGGRPIIEHQAMAEKLADTAISLEVARNMIWAAAWAAGHPEATADRSMSGLPLATIARVFTAKSIYKSTKDSAEFFGAMSVMRDIPLHKHIGDARRCLHAGTGMADAQFAIAEAVAGFRRD